jgi:CheY-like chemotaxis protein
LFYNKVLLADDDSFNLIVLEGLFNLLDISIDKVDNGWAVLEIVNNAIRNGRFYDLIILDNQMPYLTGVEVAHKLRSQ